MAIGITLNLSNSSFPPLPPTPPLPFRAPLRSKTSLKKSPPFHFLKHALHPFPTIKTLLSRAPSSYTFFPSLQRHPTGAPKPGLTMPAPQPPKRCLNQPPTAIPAMLSTLLSPFQLVPGFRLYTHMGGLMVGLRIYIC